MSAVLSLFGRRYKRGDAAEGQRLPSGRGMTRRRAGYLFPLAVLAATVTAACGGGELAIVNPEGGATIELDFPPGEVTEHKLPTILDGLLPYEASIEGCPQWVRLLFPDLERPGQRILAGAAPYQDQGKSFFCTYRVTEDDSGFRRQRSVTYGLRLAVGSASVDGLALPPRPHEVNLSVGTFHSEDLKPASGGVRPYTYSFTCAGGELPPGMGFAPETRRFAGTPNARFRDSCTYTVTDSAEPAATVSRAVEVVVTSPILTLGDPDDIGLSVGELHNVPLPEATGGIEPYTYSFTCGGGQLPSGMDFAPETRRFAGTPDAPFRDSCTYSVTDSAEPAATVSRAVEVEVTGAATARLTLPTLSKIELSVGKFRSIALPAASGGVRPYTYSFTCAGGEFPSGMGFAPATRMFAGTPDASFRDSCTYTAADGAEPAATVSRAVEVEVSGRAVTLSLAENS
jgi:hypothetical protein